MRKNLEGRVDKISKLELVGELGERGPLRRGWMIMVEDRRKKLETMNALKVVVKEVKGEINN